MFRDPIHGVAELPLRLFAALALAALWLSLAMPAVAQPPTSVPTPILIDPLDPRAGNESVNLVGTPLLAVVVVLATGAIAAAGTIAYVKLSNGRGRPR